MKFVLDTSFIINYLRHGGKWEEEIAKLRADGEFEISVITYGELYYGSLRASNPIKEKEKYESFLKSFGVEIVPLETKIVEVYAQTKLSLEKKGERLDDFDILIGAAAIVNDAILVTDNIKHFVRFPKLEVYTERR